MCKMGCGCTKKSKFALPQMNGGGKTDPPGEGKAAKKKRARIIANSLYPEFKTEYERTKAQYAKHYPDGVEFVPAYGEQQLNDSLGKVAPDEDLIIMDHFSKEKMFGVPITGEEGSQTISGMLQGLEGRGYQGNCYLGVCHGEITGRDLQYQGVDIPFFAPDDSVQWAGGNNASQGSFEDFFFGLKPKEMFVPGGGGIPDSSVIQPKLGEDYEMLFSERHQELMNRRASGTPQTALPKPNIKRDLLTKEKSIALAANQF